MSDRSRSVRDAVSRRHLIVVGTVLVVAAGGAIAVRTVDPGKVLAALRGADPLLSAAAAVAYLLSWPVRGRRYEDVLAAMGHRCGVGFLTAAVFLSQSANLAVPARAGDGIRAYLLNARRDVPYATGAASLAVERAFDLAALAALGGGALASLLLTGRAFVPDDVGVAGVGVPEAAGVAVLAVVLSAVAVGTARSERGVASVVRDRIERPLAARIVDAAVRFGADVRVVVARPRALAAIGAGSAAVWLLDVLAAVLVLAAVGAGLSLPALAAVGTLAVSAGNLAKVLPLSQGGIGLYEAAFAAIVAGIAPVGAGTALAAAILDHALKNVLTIGGGGLAAVRLGVSPLRAARDRGSDSFLGLPKR